MNKTIHNALSLMVDSNLTVREWYVLSLVQQNSGSSLIDLTPKQSMPKSTLGRLVSHLSSMGLVSALPDLTDYRRQVLMVTDKGIEQLCLLSGVFSQMEQPIGCLIPDECPLMIVFEDNDRPPLTFAGHGAKEAANKAFEKISLNWNAHLFARIKCNTSDDRYPILAADDVIEIKSQAIRDFILWGTTNLDPEFSEFSDCAEKFIEIGMPTIAQEEL